MPTNAPHDPPSRRRPLGRGPGTAPPAAGPDDARAPSEADSEAPGRPGPRDTTARKAEAHNATAEPPPAAEPDPPPPTGGDAAPAEAHATPPARRDAPPRPRGVPSGTDGSSAVSVSRAGSAVEAPGTAPAPGAREAAAQAAPGEVPGPAAVPPPGAAPAEAQGAASPARGTRGGERPAGPPRTAPPPAQGDASPQQPVRPRGGYAPSGAGGASAGAGDGESEPAHERAGGEDGPDGGAVRGHGAPLDGGAGPPRGGDGEAAVTGAEGPQDGEPAGDGQPVGDGAGADEGVAAEDHSGTFTVRLDNFEGPFDLLLQLISKHKMDVTEVALSKVTDEFMAHIRAMGPDWDLDQTTEFLVVAATLLDLKAARLLPAAEVEDEADLALLEARDLLFARLLQYRAYKRIADIFNDRLIEEARRYPRTVGLEPHHAELLPDVVIRIGPEGFAKLAVKAMQAKPKPQVYVDHIHAPLVSVREQAEVVVGRLRELGEASFATLTADAPDTLTVVARFLALLELYRERAVLLEQPEALGALMVRWSGAEDGQRPLVTDEFDQEAQAQNAQAQEVRT